MRVQAVQQTVGMNLVKLWDASDRPGLQLQLVLGGYCSHSWQSATPLTALAMLPRSGCSIVTLLFGSVLLCRDHTGVPVRPPSCCGDCLCLSLHTESLYQPEMLLGFLWLVLC